MEKYDEQYDDDAMLDQVASECMEAIEKKDKESFKECFHVLVADLMHKMSNPQPEEKE